VTLSKKVKDESITFFEAFKEEPYLRLWFGDTGDLIIDYVVPSPPAFCSVSCSRSPR
jgi:hypothetical protein